MKVYQKLYQPDLQASGNTVMHLMSKVQCNNWCKLFMDNWYTGVPLVSTLMHQGIAVVGKVRSNRLKGCVLSNDKVMRQKGRGSSEAKTSEVDGCAVTIPPTYEAIQPSTKVKRWDQENGQEIQVDCPSAEVTYNQNMGVCGFARWT